MRETVRVVKPGGVITVFFGNFHRSLYLPGYHKLEYLAARAESLRWQNEAPMSSASSVPNAYEQALRWLQATSLRDCKVTIHPLVYQQPLPLAAREYLEDYLFAEAFGPTVQRYGADVGMSDDERTFFQKLTTPGSPQYLLDQPEYYCLQTAVLATGRV